MRGLWRCSVRIGVIPWLLLAPGGLAAATYYVDFANGDDRASGLSPADAWKRAPGDSRAGPAPRATRLQPGDTVLFRGGVAYRGTVVVRAAGTADAPIRYVGDGWGPGPAVVDGSEPIGKVRACPSGRACGGEAGWRGLLQVTLPEQVVPWDGLFQGERPVRLVEAGARLQPGDARALPGGRLVVNPLPGEAGPLARGAARVGFLLVAGGHVEISGFGFSRFAPAPRKGPYAGAPVVQLQPLPGLRLAGLPAPLVAAPPVKAIAGVTSGPV
jgi:hypothetical protein